VVEAGPGAQAVRPYSSVARHHQELTFLGELICANVLLVRRAIRSHRGLSQPTNNKNSIRLRARVLTALTRRHGCAAVCIEEKLCVVGGYNGLSALKAQRCTIHLQGSGVRCRT
jgi:hypothetical protein